MLFLFSPQHILMLNPVISSQFANSAEELSHASVETELERENPVFRSSLAQKWSRKLLLSAASLNAKNSPSAACVRFVEVVAKSGMGGGGEYVSSRVCLTRAEGSALVGGQQLAGGIRADPSTLIRGEQQLRRGEQQGDVPSIT